MNGNQYRISVVLPVYNGIKYLQENIDSLLNQTITDYEVIISDDGSSDGSRALLEALRKEGRPNVRIFLQEKNLGLFENLNFLIGKASSTLVHLWAQDDLMKPECLEEVIRFHRQHPGISMSYHAVEDIDENGVASKKAKVDHTPAVISPGLYARISIRWGCITGNIANVTLVKPYLDRYGYFNPALKASGDFELFTRLAAEHPIGFLNKKLMYLRFHKGQLSRKLSTLVPFVLEDIPVYQKILEQQEAADRPSAYKHWKWKVQVIYMNYLVFLLRKGELKESIRLFRILKKEFGVYGLFLRWSVVRMLGVLRLKDRFYQRLD